jgi:hypothetical protein
MLVRSIKAYDPRLIRVDDYEPKDDAERRRRVEAHRRRIQRELKRQKD